MKNKRSDASYKRMIQQQRNKRLALRRMRLATQEIDLDTYSYLGEIIAEQRNALDYTREYVAEHSKVTAPTVRGIEEGVSTIKLLTFLDMCKVLDLSPYDTMREIVRYRKAKAEDTTD